MNTPTPAIVEVIAAEAHERNGDKTGIHETNGHGHYGLHLRAPVPSPEHLRQVAWDIGEQKPGDRFVPGTNHVGLAMVNPHQGYAHWHILQSWIDQVSRQRGDAWRDCRLILRLYDVSYLIFDGFNAHRIQDHPLPAIVGHQFFHLTRPGTWQLAEVGFLLRTGEFIAASRSPVVKFAVDAFSHHHSHEALLVDEKGRVKEIGNLWEQDQVLTELRKPKLRTSLHIAAFAFEALATGHQGVLPKFVTELAAGQAAQGHQVDVFVPASDHFNTPREVDGVRYQPLHVRRDLAPVEQALSYARAAEKRLQDLPPFDLFHVHEWMTGLAPWIGTRPTVLSLSSIEPVRRNGEAPSPLSLDIQEAERGLAHAVDCILTPDWLRDRAIEEFGIDGAFVHAFPMEAKLPNEWELPLDVGKVKMEIGVGPLDRMLLFIGPLEYAAGVDLLVEAMPTALRRAHNLRLAFAGGGSMHDHLAHRAHQLGVGHAVRLLGHVERHQLTRLLRAAEAVVLPSRQRVAFDDAVVDLARRAGRPVVTTHSGPSYLIKHEENGLVTYDNPGSMVWALDRIFGDPGHADRMGRNGRHNGSSTVSWSEVVRIYLEMCAACFPELRENSI